MLYSFSAVPETPAAEPRVKLRREPLNASQHSGHPGQDPRPRGNNFPIGGENFGA